MFFLHYMLNILRYEKIFYEIDEWIASYHDPPSDVIFWVIIVNLFSLLWSIFFLSRKLCFLWSHCLLLIAESISIYISGKPTVGLFLKIASSSWIILSIWLDEVSLIDWLLKSWWWIFLKWLFYWCKRIFIWQKMLEVFWRI